MTDAEMEKDMGLAIRFLLEQNEAKAVNINELEKEIERLRGIVNGIPHTIESAEQQVYQSMSEAAINCGSSYGCSLARRRVE